ncbi:helix-turn-helix transcriptional regulator [Solirubrobacter soli]|uniref:helix-turn-helix transcriptional regulator n=1 Tax=Solirubrobacter soli TaxID=363832 RepID=UPI000409DBF8|nr:LuxR family transcriptional regulator [Solirubrobacter soli]
MSELRGRAEECARLDALLRDIRRGDSRSLVLRGEAGVGKTALLEYVVDAAADETVVRAVGVESEMELAYAGLHQLSAPLLDRLPRLPVPQREALEIVFGVRAGLAPDRFLVALSVLSLLSLAGERRPLLCVVDDAQWLDQASAVTLAFVARRLLADPVGIVFAARDPGELLRQLPELEVRGVSRFEARALLSTAVRFKLDERVRDRIVDETRGNPLALLELPRGLTAVQLAGGFGLPEAQALTGRIQESFVRRLETLSGDARRLLLLAAAEPLGDSLLLLRACDRLGIPSSLVDTEIEGLLTIGERVTFRHPLVRSAVYRTATAHERRVVHLALAEATDRDVDPDRRAWHLAAAAMGPDEEVAVELERSAAQAQGRGGLAAAAAFLQRAAALTQDPAQRAARALAAAHASFQGGAFDTALELLATAEDGPLDALQRAQVDLRRGHVAFASGLGRDAPALLLGAARRLEALDLDLARETYLTAWGAAAFAGPAAGGVLMETCRAVRELPPPSGAARPLALLLDGLALLTTDGHAAAAPTLQHAVRLLSRIPVGDVLRWGWAATAASDAIWDEEATRLLSARHVKLVRDAGALSELPIHLAASGLAKVWVGDFGGAASLIAESEGVAAATGSPIAPYTLLRLRALQGREAEAQASIASAIDRATSEGQGLAAAWAHWAAAVLYNGLGRYSEAASAASQATSYRFEPWVSKWALPELVEAAARGNDRELARDALARLMETTQPCGTDFALGIEARCRALLTDGPAADASYREAIDRLGRTQLRPELARAHLLYGEWLRRENRRRDARRQLRAAHDQFAAIGMAGFAERARGERHATGERVRERTVATRDDLTAQERQIASLAGDGLSNSEIGSRLFLSSRTVEWHLHNVFTKLGIRSRQELPRTERSTGIRTP